MKVPIHQVHWKHCWRVIPTRYPSENLLERVVDLKDKPAVDQLDALTSTRSRLERGELELVPAQDEVRGPGSQYIMASFSYSLFNSSRFSDGSYGVYYAAKGLSTAIAETCFHREKFMRATAEDPMMLSMRVIDATLAGFLHDVRKWRSHGVRNRGSYLQSQVLGRRLWGEGSNGIVYDSVRQRKGECVAVFKPSLLTHCRQERQLIYEWNGRKIDKIYALQEFLKMK